MSTIHGTAFITTKKGFCYLTIKSDRRNFPMMRIRNYTIEPDEKRHMRHLYPNVTFDWKKIAQQLAAKREVCRQYRSRRRRTTVPRVREPFYGMVDPRTRTVYVNDPTNIAGVGALLDTLLAQEKHQTEVPE